MEHFLQGAWRLSNAGVASLWLPTISGELTMHRQMNAATDTFAPLSHEPWQQLAETIFQSAGILLRERATSTNMTRENLLATAGRSYRLLGIPLRASDRPGAPAGVLLLENPVSIALSMPTSGRVIHRPSRLRQLEFSLASQGVADKTGSAVNRGRA